MQTTQPSSICPLQLSSRPLPQISLAIAGRGVQVCGVPDTQPGTVLRQMPRPHEMLGMPLSTVPSQSSSIPLQVSARGAPGVQLIGTPAVHDATERMQAPTPHYAGVITAYSDSSLRFTITGDTTTAEGRAVAIAQFGVDFTGARVMPRIREPLPEADLSPVSGLTVRWSDLPGFDQVEATVASNTTPPTTVTARGVTDLGFLTFSKAQIASLPEGAATLTVTRSRVRNLSVSGLIGGTATLAATVTVPVSIVAPVMPYHEDGTQ